jgi:hypothetical protein
MTIKRGRGRMSTPAVPPSRMGYQVHPPRGFFTASTLRLCLILFLAVTFFLLCPLWAYLSLCSLSAHYESGQGCFLYSFVFNMPASLASPAILLFILASFGYIAVYRHPLIFPTPFSQFLARAPPLH